MQLIITFSLMLDYSVFSMKVRRYSSLTLDRYITCIRRTVNDYKTPSINYHATKAAATSD